MMINYDKIYKSIQESNMHMHNNQYKTLAYKSIASLKSINKAIENTHESIDQTIDEQKMKVSFSVVQLHRTNLEYFKCLVSFIYQVDFVG